MSEELTVEVTDVHAQLHESLTEQLGEEYEDQLARKMENVIHDTYQAVEHQTEASE